MVPYSKAEGNNNAQLSTGYIIYMMIGSYYKSCRMTNPFMESRLKLNWKSMRTQKQYDMEAYIDDHFREEALRREVADTVCTVKAVVRNRRILQMWFRTGIPEKDLVFQVDTKGHVRLLQRRDGAILSSMK